MIVKKKQSKFILVKYAQIQSKAHQTPTTQKTKLQKVKTFPRNSRNRARNH